MVSEDLKELFKKEKKSLIILKELIKIETKSKKIMLDLYEILENKVILNLGITEENQFRDELFYLIFSQLIKINKHSKLKIVFSKEDKDEILNL